MTPEFPSGVWPVMLTPFTVDNKIDFASLEGLVNWYVDNGVAGLFAVCQSSEMFYLSLEERIQLASAVKAFAKGRVPVIASGHISDKLSDQIDEINAMVSTGVDAVVLITNRLAAESEDDTVWLKNLQTLLASVDKHIPLGFYECPYPYKRVMSAETTQWCAQSGRFHFLKDTSCDIENIKMKLNIIKGSSLRLFNANVATLLESLELGASGFSGVMANFHPHLFVELCNNYKGRGAGELSDLLTTFALIERQYYPVSAKYYLNKIGITMETICRTKDKNGLNDTLKKEIDAMSRVADRLGSF